MLDVRDRCIAVDHPDLGGQFSLRPLRLPDDLELIHSWMNDAEVARFWKMAWPRERIAAYLRDQQLSAHSAPYVGELDGTPMSYWELYRADLDPLAAHYPAREHDVAFHMLLGPAGCRGRGLAAGLMRTVSSWLLDADPLAERVIGEPDAGHERVLTMLERAGFHRAGVLDLPHKRAALMIRDRD